MALDDESAIKIIQTLGLNYNPAISATKTFEMHIAKLNKELFDLQATALGVGKSINNGFATQLGNMKIPFNAQTVQDARNSKIIVDQYGKTLADLTPKLERAAQNQNKYNAELRELIQLRKTQQIDAQTFVEKASLIRDNPVAFNSLGTQGQISLVRELTNAEKEHHRVLNQSLGIRDLINNEVKLETLARMEATAATIQQKVASKGISEDYSIQAGLLRKQVAELQNKLQIEGKLSAQEINQTQNLKQQLSILQSQTMTASADVPKGSNVNILEQGFQRRAEWFLTGSIFFGITNGAKQAVESISEVGLGVTEIARVMEDSAFVFDDYRDALLNFGVDYASTFENTQDIALRWAQAGYNVEDSLKATQTSLLALNTAELDASSSTEGLIGIMAQWKMDIVDLPLILDEINKTADDFTVTSQDLVDGLLRSSGAAKIMGLSLEETISLLTVMREASGRTGQEVGNALNSILSYVQRPVAIKTFEDLGIQVFADEAKTQFRNVMDIFDDVSAKWGSLAPEIQDGFVKAADDAGLYNEELANAIGTQELWNDLQQRDLSQAAAGVYRRNYFIGMIERLSTAQDVLNNMTDASGYSMAENERTMETLAKKYESFKASLEQLSVSMGDAGLEGMLKGLTDAGTDTVNMINEMPPGIRNAIVLYAELTLTLVAVKQILRMLGVEAAFAGITQGVTGLIPKVKALGIAFKTTFISNLPLLATTAAITAIAGITMAIQKAKEEQEAFIQTTKENIESLDAERKGLQGLASEYETLKSRQENLTATADEKLRLLDIQKELVSQYQVSITGINSEGQAYNDSIESINLRTSAIEAEIEAEKERLKIAVEAKDIDVVKDISKQKEKLKESEILKEMYKAQLDDLKNSYAEKKSIMDYYTGSEISPDDSSYYQYYLNSKSLLSEWLLKYTDDSEKITTKIETISAERVKALQNDANDTIEQLESGGAKISDASKAFANEIARVLGERDVSFVELQDKLQKSIIQLNNTNFDELVDEYSRLSSIGDEEGMKKVSNQIKDLVEYLTDGVPELTEFVLNLEAAFSGNLPESSRTLIDIGSNMEALSSIVTSTSGEISGLNSILNGLSIENTLSSETITDLILKYPELSKSIVKVGDSYTIEKNAIEAVRLVRINEQKDAILAQSGITEAVKIEISKRLANYGIELEAIKTLEDVRNASNKAFTGTYQSAVESFNLGKTLGDYVNAQNYINSLIGQLSDPSYGVSKSSSTSKDQNKQLQGALGTLDHRKKMSEQTIKSIESEINELKRIKSQYAKTADEKADMDEKIYEAEKRLTSEKQKLSASYFETEKNNIQELYDMTLISTQDQIELFRNLYESRAMSLTDIQEMNKSIFSSYKTALGEELENIKDAYDERIDLIEKEAEAKKKVQEDIIKGIELELDLLDKREATRDYDKKMADLQEELAYWSVRTGEEARKKLADINEQIAEAQHDREVELQKESLEEKKQNAQEKIDAIEDAAKKEKEKLEIAYSLVEETFDEHGINMVALASTMSKDAFTEWQNNYFTKLQTAFSAGDYGSVGNITESALSAQKSINNNAKIYQLASSILSFKEKYEIGGDKTAAQSVLSYYNQLDSIAKNVSDQLHGMNYLQAKDYVNSLPKAHGGGETLSYGAVYMKPGEIIFPPNLGNYLKEIIAMAKGYSEPNRSSNNIDRSVTINGPLFNSERTVIEDETDSTSFANELKKALSNL